MNKEAEIQQEEHPTHPTGILHSPVVQRKEAGEATILIITRVATGVLQAEEAMVGPGVQELIRTGGKQRTENLFILFNT